MSAYFKLAGMVFFSLTLLAVFVLRVMADLGFRWGSGA